MLNQEIKKKILQNAISLERYGLNDLAWSKQDAKNLIHAIITDRIGILGGDVFKRESDRLKPLYDNWSCEPRSEESEQEYYARSKYESLNYIEMYPIMNGEDIIFSITFTNQVIFE